MSEEEKQRDEQEKCCQEKVEQPLDRIVKAALGLLILGEEKLGDAIDTLAEKGETAGNDARIKVTRLLDKLEEEKSLYTTRIADEVKAVIDRIPFATKDDVARLEKKLEELEKKLAGG